MEIHRIDREFLYNRVKLPDAAPTMTPEQVRDTYTQSVSRNGYGCD
jgi:PRTRC genetic system protein C